MNNRLTRWCLAVFLWSSTLIFSQKSIEILDLNTKEAIPFAKIYPSNASPFLADIDGRFIWQNEWQTIRISSNGYKDTIYTKEYQESSLLFLAPKIQNIQEVSAVAGENPAHRIMDLVIANRKKNHPLENESFTYRSYSKFVTEVDEKILESIPDTSTDQSLISSREFIKNNHLFLIETSSIRSFSPPSRDKEEIIAYKASGIQDPIFATIANELQSFCFYENQFYILSKTYINPIALGGTNRYLFQIIDTTFEAKDTVFHITFRPRKNKNFDGLAGTLFINSNGYAIERVIAEPYLLDASEPKAKIIQEYQFLNNTAWFPVKLSSELILPQVIATVGDSAIKLLSKSSTYIDSVVFNPENGKKLYFDNANLIVQSQAGEIQDSTWNTLRKYELTEKERNTYKTIDSVAKANNLGRLVYAMKVLATGKIPLKYLNADINRLLGYNEHEGFRLGLGLHTSEKLLKSASLGGYFAYGFKDQAYKWGGDLTFFIYPQKSLVLQLAYHDDVFERGRFPYLAEQNGFSSNAQLRSLYVRYMDRYRQAKADLSIYATSNFRLGLESKYERIRLLQGYELLEITGIAPLTITPLKQYDDFSLSASIKWNIREKVNKIGNQRIAMESTFPLIYASATKGFAGIGLSKYEYTRLFAELSHKVVLRGLGVFKYRVNAGNLLGNAPLINSFGLFNSFSSRNKLNLSIENTFETLENKGYFFTRYVGVFTRLEFNKWKKFKTFRPQLCIHHAFGYGAGQSVLDNFVSLGLENGHVETGLIINNLLNNLGLGVFYNYGPLRSSNPVDNLFLKLSFSLTF